MKNNAFPTIDWNKNNGLVPTIIQNSSTKQVLMLAYMSKEALKKTLKNNKVWFFSRSRQKLWMKGEESQNYLIPISIKTDCDKDTILIQAQPQGPTCHTGKISCFDAKKGNKKKVNVQIIEELFNIIQKRKKEKPKNSYTTKLLEQGLDKICTKITEESDEVIQAAKKETKKRLIEETIDLIYHLFVLLVSKGVKFKEILTEIQKRRQ